MNRSVSNESSTSPHMDDTERRLEFELEQCPAPGAKKVRKLSDKRAEQVRLAQARFRAKKKMKIKELEVKLKLLTEVHNVNPTDLPQAVVDRSSTNTEPLPINETLGSSSSNSSGSGKLLRERKRVKSYAVDNDDDEDEYIPEYVVASGSVIEGRNDNDSHTNHDEYIVTSGEGEIMVDESRLDPALLEKLKRDPRGNAELLKQLPTALRRQLQVRSAQRNFWMRKQQRIKDLEAQVAVLEALDQGLGGASTSQVPAAAEPSFQGEDLPRRVARPLYESGSPPCHRFEDGASLDYHLHAQAVSYNDQPRYSPPKHSSSPSRQYSLESEPVHTSNLPPIRLPPIQQMLQIQQHEAPFYNSLHPPPPLPPPQNYMYNVNSPYIRGQPSHGPEDRPVYQRHY